MKKDDELTNSQRRILRERGTEAPFTGKLLHVKDDGDYLCAACGNKLFDSSAKFTSNSGWPSFDQAIEGSVKLTPDYTHGMVRTSVECAKCDGHLGHVFGDNSETSTDQRFCINSTSLNFMPEDSEEMIAGADDG